MKIFAGKQKMPALSEQTKKAWWDVFTNALYMGVDDCEDLIRARDPEVARKLADGAGNIADAAISQFEERWPGE